MSQVEGATGPDIEAEVPTPEPAGPHGLVMSDGTPNGFSVYIDGKEVGATSVVWKQRAGEWPRLIVEIPLSAAEVRAEVEVIRPLSPGGFRRLLAWAGAKIAGALRGIAGILDRGK